MMKSSSLCWNLMPNVVVCYYLHTGIAIGKYCISQYCKRKKINS